MRLAHCLDDSRSIARLEADRFAVMHAEAGDDEGLAIATAEQMRRSFGEPFSLEGREYRLDAKAGIAVFPGDGADPHRLL
jgi:GGDEF domain-containing protein